MSAAAGIAHKGESKSKKSYATLDINNIYKGKPLEGPKSTTLGAGAKHGLQSLGKVQVGRRMPPPALLPSLKSENLGNNPNVTLVPQGGQGWGVSKNGGPAGGPGSQQLDQATSHLDGRGSMGPPGGDSLAGGGGQNGNNKTWSSVAVQGGGHHHNGNQLPFYPAEFPTLKTDASTGAAAAGGTASGGAAAAGTDHGGHHPNSAADRDNNSSGGGTTSATSGSQYGPGPALRPAESNWSRGSAAAGANAGSGVNGSAVASLALKPRPPSPLGSSPGDPLGMGYPPTLSKGLGSAQQHGTLHNNRHHGHHGPPGDHRGSSGMMVNGASSLFGREREEREGGGGPMGGPRGGRGDPRGSRGYRGDRGGDPHDSSKSVLKHSTIISDRQLEGFDRILSTGDSDWSAAKGDIDYNAKLCFSDDEEEPDNGERAANLDDADYGMSSAAQQHHHRGNRNPPRDPTRDSASPGGGYQANHRGEQPSQKQLWTPSGHADGRPERLHDDAWSRERHGRLKDNGRSERRGAPQQQCVFEDNDDNGGGNGGGWRHRGGERKNAKHEINECVERARMMRRDSERQLSERHEDDAYGDRHQPPRNKDNNMGRRPDNMNKQPPQQQLPPRFAKMHLAGGGGDRHQQGGSEGGRGWGDRHQQGNNNNRSRSDSSSSNNNPAGGALDSRSAGGDVDNNVWQMNKENRARSMRGEDNKSPSPGSSSGAHHGQPDNMWHDHKAAGWSQGGSGDQGSGLFDGPQQAGRQGREHSGPATGKPSNLDQDKQHRAAGFVSLKKDGAKKESSEGGESDKIDGGKVVRGAKKSGGGGGHESDGVTSSNDDERGFSPRGEPSRRGRGGGRAPTSGRPMAGGAPSRQYERRDDNGPRGGSGGGPPRGEPRDQQRDQRDQGGAKGGAYPTARDANKNEMASTGRGGARNAGGNARGGPTGQQQQPQQQRGGAPAGKEDTPPRFRRHDDYDDQAEEDEQRGGGKFGQQQRQQQSRDGGAKQPAAGNAAGSRDSNRDARQQPGGRGGATAAAADKSAGGRPERSGRNEGGKQQQPSAGGAQDAKKTDGKAVLSRDHKKHDGQQPAKKDAPKSASLATANADGSQQQQGNAGQVAGKKDGAQLNAGHQGSAAGQKVSTVVAQKKEPSSPVPLKNTDAGSNAWGDSEVTSSAAGGIEFGTLGESDDLNLKIQSVKKVWDTSAEASSQPTNQQSAHHGIAHSGGSQGAAVSQPQGASQAAQAAQAAAQQMSFFQMDSGAHKDPSAGSPLGQVGGQGGVMSSDLSSSAQHNPVTSSLHQAYASASGQQQQQQQQQAAKQQQATLASLSGHPQQQQQYYHMMQQKYHQSAGSAQQPQQPQQQRSAVHHQMTGYTGQQMHTGQSGMETTHQQQQMMRAAFAAHSQQHSQQMYAAANSQFQSPPPAGATAAAHPHLAASGQPATGQPASAADHSYGAHSYFSQQQPPHAAAAPAPPHPDLYRYQQAAAAQQQHGQYRNYFPAAAASAPYASATPQQPPQQSYHQMGGHGQATAYTAAAFSGMYTQHPAAAQQQAARYGQMKDPQQPSYDQSTPPPYGQQPSGQQASGQSAASAMANRGGLGMTSQAGKQPGFGPSAGGSLFGGGQPARAGQYGQQMMQPGRTGQPTGNAGGPNGANPAAQQQRYQQSGPKASGYGHH